MRIIVAPDSFKGSLSAVAAAEAMKRGVEDVFADAEVVMVPVADGGEGTVEALVRAAGGEFFRTVVSGPLGAPVEALWGMLADGETAVVEMAAASGLTLLSPEERNPLVASTAGTGQLAKAAFDKGARRIILGIGGSATNDGGAGFASALGIRFLDAEGRVLPEGGASLAGLERIDCGSADPRLREVSFVVACDVDNPLCGPQGASAVFGPQKGADPDTARRLDAALLRYGTVAARATGRDVANVPGAGAAGGLGAGLLFFTSASLRPGIEIVLETVRFASLVAGADLVITGEGRSDGQTAHGKAPVGVAKIAGARGVPVVCLSGGLGPGYRDVYAHGIDAAHACPYAPMTLEECMKEGPELVRHATERLCRVLRVGMRMGV